MKVHQDRGYKVQSTLVGEKVAMGISTADLPHLMGVLTDLYSNKRRAVLREYSTNGFDAVVEAVEQGLVPKFRPIEVTLPTQLSPFLSIRDYGVGLSVEDIHEIYSQYGRSTKRATNTQVGQLGLGCKSALTYCSQFTVVSIQNGTKITVNIGREDNGAGAMQVVDTSATTDPNGTTITIPVPRGDESLIADEAQDFFSVWERGTVLVNGKQPARFDGMKLSDDLYITEGDDQDRIVMGNVAYPAPQLASVTGRGVSLTAFVPIGAVGFVPSREALDDTQPTRDTIAAIRKKFETVVTGAVQREVDAAPTPAAAVATVVRWSRYLRDGQQQGSYTYRGNDLPLNIKARPDAAGVTPPIIVTPNNAYSSRRSTYYYRGYGWSAAQASIPLAELPTTVWVKNFAPTKFTAQHKRKLQKWVDTQANLLDPNNPNKHLVSQFACVPNDAPDSAFIDPAYVADWTTVRSIQLQPKVSNPAAYNYRIPGSYDVWTEDGWKHGVQGSDLRDPAKVPMFFMRGNRWQTAATNDCLAAIHGKYTLVCLPGNRIDKFKRDVPAAKPALEGVKAGYDAWKARHSQDQLIALKMRDTHVTRNFQGLDPDKVKDPELRKAAKIAKIDVSKLAQERRAFEGVLNARNDESVKWTNPLTKYPLFLPHLSGHAHTYLYLNAAYAARP